MAAAQVTKSIDPCNHAGEFKNPSTHTQVVDHEPWRDVDKPEITHVMCPAPSMCASQRRAAAQTGSKLQV